MTKTKRPIERKESQHKAAARLTVEMGFEVTRAMVRVWKRKCYDLTDIEKLKEHLKNSERPPAGLRSEKSTTKKPPSTDTPPATPAELEQRLGSLQRELLSAADYETARTIKTKIAGLKELHRAQVERGLYMLTSDAESAGMEFGLFIKGVIEGLEDELPPQLEGLPALRMKKQLRDFARSKLLEMQKFFPEKS